MTASDREMPGCDAEKKQLQVPPLPFAALGVGRNDNVCGTGNPPVVLIEKKNFARI